MKLRLLALFIGLLLQGCQQQPASRWPIYTAEDDQLSDREKISLLQEKAASLSSSGYGTIAQLYEHQQEYEKALTAIDEAIEHDPLNSSYHSLKASYAFAAGDRSTAYREALTAYQLGSGSLKQSLELAKMAAALSEFKIVGNMIDSLLVVYPDDPTVVYLAARKYEKDGNIERALVNYAQVYAKDPDNLENNFYYARLLKDQGQYEQAKKVALQGGLLEGKQGSYLIATLYHDLALYDSSAYWYQQALRYSADSVTYALALKNYLRAGITDSVLSTALAGHQGYPENKFFLHTAARQLDKQRDYQQALTYYQTLYALDTLDTLVAEELAYLQRKIAYLQRRQREQQKLADSLSRVLPVITF